MPAVRSRRRSVEEQRLRGAAVWLLAPAAILVVLAFSVLRPSVREASVAAAPICRARPLAGVHDPQRLKVLRACAVAVGTVVRAPALNPDDGDVTFNLRLDPRYAWMLDEGNRREGGIHVEIVPADQRSCLRGKAAVWHDVSGLGRCTGARVAPPRLGAHVRVVGAYVYDPDSDWNEIHPVWRIAPVRAHS